MILDEIAELTKERGRDYSHPLPNFLRISLDWSIETAPFLFNPILVARLMNRMKLDRGIDTPKWDNNRDNIGYENVKDMMCQKYAEIELGTLLSDYEEMDDKGKEYLENVLRNLSFGEQYSLLCKCIKVIE